MDTLSFTSDRSTALAKRLAAVIFASLLATAPALAVKPDSVGKDKEKKHEQVSTPSGHQDKSGKDGNSNNDVKVNLLFGGGQRTIVRDYYRGEFGRGHCPPGLAKKNNGCLPPGQAKKWVRGQPLPRDVVFYELPRGLLSELGQPPAGHKFVRVGADILLLTLGTSLVVDAIENLGGL